MPLPCLLATFSLLTNAADAAFVQVSPRDHRYLELSDGRPYIPIGLNIVGPPGGDWPTMVRWLDELAANRANYIRIWAGTAWFDVEHERSGQYDPAKGDRIAQLLKEAGDRGIKVKVCLEFFRHFGTTSQTWAEKRMHLKSEGGPAGNIADFFDGEASRAQFKQKLAWFRNRFGDDPTVFAWELWNEINAVAGGDVVAWTQVMLTELQRLFPKNLNTQSFGSYDREEATSGYQRLTTMPDNDLAQVHRYLDLGARLEVCHGPVDILAADAVRRIQANQPGRPILLAESGGVEPKHTGPFKLYAQDTQGIILHDVLFAPFFVGAAGPGHIWHWDAYVAKNNLWWQFDRFAQTVDGLDPAAEAFEPSMIDHPRLRIYVLKGKSTTLVWLRDSQNDWRAELERGQAPQPVEGVTLPAALATGGASWRAFDPWQNTWGELAAKDGQVALPAFKRSLVVRAESR